MEHAGRFTLPHTVDDWTLQLEVPVLSHRLHRVTDLRGAWLLCAGRPKEFGAMLRVLLIGYDRAMHGVLVPMTPIEARHAAAELRAGVRAKVTPLRLLDLTPPMSDPQAWRNIARSLEALADHVTIANSIT